MDSENEFLDSSHMLAEACVRVTRNRGIALSCGSLTAFAICASSIPPFTTTIAAFLGVSYARFGYLFFLQYLFFTVASLSLGWGKKRFGFSNKSIVALGLVGSGVFFIVGACIRSVGLFYLWIIPFGFFGGAIETFSSVILSRLEKVGSSRLMNFSQVFYCLGAIAAPQAVSIFLKIGVSWQAAFVLFGLLICALAAAFAVFFKVPESSSLEVLSSGSSKSKRSESEGFKRQFSGSLFADPRFLLMSFSLFLYVAVEATASIWSAPYFEHTFSLPAYRAAWRMGIFWGGIVCGRASMIFLPQRFTLWPAVLFGSALMILTSLFLSLISGIGISTLILFLLGLCAGPVWTAIVSLTKNIPGRGEEFTSGVIGIGALGAAFGPMASSLIMKRWGTGLLFPLLVASSALLFLVFLSLKRMLRA